MFCPGFVLCGYFNSMSGNDHVNSSKTKLKDQNHLMISFCDTLKECYHNFIDCIMCTRL